MSDKKAVLYGWITGSAFWGNLFFLIALIALGYLIYVIVAYSQEFGLSTLALLGVVALLGVLLVFTTVLHAVGLSNDQQALGLPEGSVRALLALALLGLFAIMASSVLVKPEPYTVSGLQAVDINALLKNNPDLRDIVQVPEKDSNPPTFKVTFSSPARLDDFAKQMLTLIGTLMTAVISFYFGTSSVSSGPKSPGGNGGVPAAEPKPTGITPLTTTNGAQQAYTIAGTGLAGVTKVEAVAPDGKTTVAAADLKPAANAITFNLTLPTSGDWKVRIAAGSSASVGVPGKITVTNGGVPAAEPKPTGITPLTTTNGAQQAYTIAGTGLAGVTKVEAVAPDGKTTVAAADLKPAANAITFNLTLPTSGDWKVRIAVGSSASVDVPGKITVTNGGGSATPDKGEPPPGPDQGEEDQLREAEA